MSRLAAFAATLLATAALVLVPGSANAAAPAALPSALPSASACAEAPVPVMPHRGITGQLLDPPDDPVEGDPTTDPDVTWFEAYGPSGQFFTYETGCVRAGLDALTGGAASVGREATSGQTLANWIMLAPEWGTAACAALADAVYDSGQWLDVLNPVWRSIGDALEQAVTRPFAPLVAVVVLLCLGWALGRGRISAFTTTLLIAVTAAALATLGGQYPVKAGQAADRVIVDTSTGIREGINGSTSANPGAAMIGELSDRVIYDRWVAGTLGDTDSPTARQYGPVLYEASHYSWVEAEQAQQDPGGRGREILEEKEAAWEAAATAIEQNDPDAYQYLTGERGAQRVGQAVNALITWSVALPMMLVSLLIVVMAFLIIRVVVVFLPVLALVVVVPRFHGVLGSVAATAGAAVVNSVVFSAIASLNAFTVVRIMNETRIDWGVRLILSLAFTVLVWVLSKPFRKLTRMVSNHDPVNALHGLGDRITSSLKGFATQAAGSTVGNVSAAVVDDVRRHGAGEGVHRGYAAAAGRGTRFTRDDVSVIGWPGESAVDVGDVTVPARSSARVLAGTAERVALPASTGAAEVFVTRHREDQHPLAHPAPVQRDGHLVHHRDSPAGRDVAGGSRPPVDGSGTFVVFDPGSGLVETGSGSR